MKISELIEMLQKEMEKEGDVEVVIEADCSYEYVAMEVRKTSQDKKVLVFW